MRIHRAIPILLLVSSGFAVSEPVVAQQAAERPKIGLTLSGGGAKGFAHLGVLKVLEEYRVPIDYITGTSMGSIMAGLYASGMTPEEILVEMGGVDWISLFRDLPPREELDYRRKEEETRYSWDIEFGVKKSGIAIRGGLLAGQKIGLLLRENTLHASGINDFDDLPIPFKAIAADLETGQSYVLEQGDLARAMRASMSIPVFFTPIEIDGRLLVDGGITENMPVDLTRSMGADIVIGVDVSEPLKSREEIINLFSVVGQLTGMLSRLNVVEQLPRLDILLDPELGELTGTDYQAAAEFVAIGEATARAQAAELRKYSLSEAEYAEYRARHRYKPSPPTRIDFIELEGNKFVDERVIRSRIRVQPGDSLDPTALQRDLASVYGVGDFELIDWVIEERDGKEGVVIKAKEKPWGPTYLHFGMLLDTNGEFTSTVNVTRAQLNSRGAEWRNDLQFGSTKGIDTEFYQPVEYRRHYFVAPRLFLRDTDQDLFDADNNRIAEYDVKRRQAELAVGRRLGQYGEFRIGVYYGNIEAVVGTGAADLSEFDGGTGGFQSRLVVDRLNSGTFPTQGYVIDLRALLSRKGVGAEDGYDKLDLFAAKFWERDRHSWWTTLNAGTSLGSSIPAYDEFLLGGLFSLSGLQDDALRGQYFGVGRIGYAYQIAQLPALLGKGLYVAGIMEAGNVWQEGNDILEELIYTWTAALGADTLFGALYLGYGVTDDGDDELYLSLGRAPR